MVGEMEKRTDRRGKLFERASLFVSRKEIRETGLRGWLASWLTGCSRVPHTLINLYKCALTLSHSSHT
jgi:hypothetical protein